jgi:hypothetical protein
VRIRYLVIGVLIVTSIAYFGNATRWAMVQSWSGPAPNMRGCSYGPLYVLTDGSPPRIWRLRSGFSMQVRLNVPAGAWGLVWDESVGGYVSNFNNSYIYRVNTAGSVLYSFRCPRPHPAEISGFGVPYGNLSVAIPDENLILYLTFTGSVVKSEPGPGTRVTAAPNYFGYLCVGDAGTHKVYTYAGTFNVPSVAGMVTNYPMSGPYDQIWLTDAATNTLQLWMPGAVQNVSPSSLGRLKALFR